MHACLLSDIGSDEIINGPFGPSHGGGGGGRRSANASGSVSSLSRRKNRPLNHRSLFEIARRAAGPKPADKNRYKTFFSVRRSGRPGLFSRAGPHNARLAAVADCTA